MAFCSKCGAEVRDDAKFCHACGAPVAAGVPTPASIHKTFKVEGKPKIIVRDAVERGRVEVKSSGTNEVTVDINFIAPEHIISDVSQKGREIMVMCQPRVHPAISWFYYLGSTSPQADVSITVPAESDLDLDSVLSQVSIVGVKGEISADSKVASMHISGCQGRLNAYSRTGSLEVDDFAGTVNARTHVGSISFRGSLANQGENLFRTNVGSIQLALKGDHDLAVELLTNIGSLLCSPELVDARREYGRYSGRIGAGSGRLTVHTNTGSITLTR